MYKKYYFLSPNHTQRIMIEVCLWTAAGFAVVHCAFWLRKKVYGANEMSKVLSDLIRFVESDLRIASLFPPKYIRAIPNQRASLADSGQEWIDQTESHVDAVREGLRRRIEEAGTIAPSFKEALEYTQAKSGKMIRSRLIKLLFDPLKSKNEGESSEKIKLLSQVVELEHCASLLHDDVVDDSDVRRGLESHRKVFGDRMAVLTGDFMISLLVDVLTEIGDMQVTKVISGSIESLVIGELLQLTSGRETLHYADTDREILFPQSVCGDMTHEPDLMNRMLLYMRKSYFKTSALFSAFSECVGLIAKEEGKTVESLSSFGFFFGLAFKIVDDLLDVDLDPLSDAGKTVGGADLRNGTVTLPILFACVENSEMKTMLKRRFALGGDQERALQLLVKSDAIQKCRKLVKHYFNRCRADLGTVSPAMDKLLLDYEFRTS